MTAMSDYLENALLDHVLRNTAYTSPTTVYVKLHTGAPGEAGTANAAGETTRVAATFGAASGGTISNSAAIQWSSVSTTETYSHISIWDHLTAGNCLLVGALSSSKAVTSGEDAEFAIGDLDVTFA